MAAAREVKSGRRLATVNAALGDAARLIGSGRFYAALLAAVREIASHDIATVVRYSAVGSPAFLLHHGYSDDLAAQYEASFFAFDPFARLWSVTERPGVVWLGMFEPAATRRSRYVREFLHASHIEDELGIFLPPVGRASIAMFLERSRGRFAPSERALAQDFYPVVAGLDAAHVNNTVRMESASFAAGAAAQERPILIQDREGETVHVNAAWRDLEASRPALSSAVERLALTESGEAALDGGWVLHRSPVAAAHAFAPGGWLFAVERKPIAARQIDLRLLARLSPELTPREIEVVKLILDGHPILGIAGKLKLSRGTVKNHRLHIYRKLDITTERELFLHYIQALRGATEAGRD